MGREGPPTGHEVQGGEGADSGGGVGWHGGLFCSTADCDSGLSVPSRPSSRGTAPASWGDRPKLEPSGRSPPTRGVSGGGRAAWPPSQGSTGGETPGRWAPEQSPSVPMGCGVPSLRPLAEVGVGWDPREPLQLDP